MKLSAQLEGLAELGATLSGLGGTAGLDAALEAATNDVRDAAVANLSDSQSPDSRTGALARSLTVTPGGDGLSFTLSTPLEYGWHLENGSLARPAAPWLAPAVDAARPAVERRLREWLTGAVRG